MRRFLLAVLLLTSLRAGAAEVYVFAAASLTDALTEIARNYEKRSADTVVFNFGSSGMLARQIEEDAPADLFISADERRMDALEKEGLIEPKTRVAKLSNALVVVVPAEGGQPIATAAQLTQSTVGRIALGDPATVPAGTYAREYLQRIGLWDRVRPKVIPMENVRATLAAVESGNVDAGIVYRTDAIISRHVRIAFEVPREQGPAISYPFALTSNAHSPGAARRFLEYLQSGPALDVFRRYGFIVH
jgi:molybdate transport system substrate-binding protein